MPKLPANLPENWTQGQTISPNGTEVGLTEQYGYNYLMKQVNNTQTEVNNINTALTDVAQQATVNEINNKIGTEADADTQPTLFGRLAQLKNVMVEKLAEVLTKVTGIDGKIGTSGDTAGSVTLFGQIKTIVDTLAGKKYRYSDTVQHTEEQSYTLGDNTAIMYNFIAEYDGNIHISVDYQRNGSSANTVACIHAIAESSWYCKGDGGNEGMIETLLSSETGTTLNQRYGGAFWSNGAPYTVYGGLTTKTGRSSSKSQIHLILHVKKGDKVVIAAVGFRESGESVTYSNLKVMYDLK